MAVQRGPGHGLHARGAAVHKFSLLPSAVSRCEQVAGVQDSFFAVGVLCFQGLPWVHTYDGVYLDH